MEKKNRGNYGFFKVTWKIQPRLSITKQILEKLFKKITIIFLHFITNRLRHLTMSIAETFTVENAVDHK